MDRAAVLRSCGAAPDDLDALLAYGAAIQPKAPPPPLPLDDEPHVERWIAYEQDAGNANSNAFESLRQRFVQLRFPIREGISKDDEYRRGTLRGQFDAADSKEFAPGLVLKAPGELKLTIESTIAGHIPVIVTGPREDFVALVRALTERNEPAVVPTSMGACIVSGLNNWDRVARHRAKWEAEMDGRAGDGEELEEAWRAEFRAFAAQKALYQDRCIILSRGPYSAVSAQAAGLSDAEWLDRSLVIRREHECTHYFTYRVFGVMRNNLIDELIADFVGLVRAFGTYRADIALHCLGLEQPDRYRPGGRLENYRGTPPLSDAAFAVLQQLARRGVRNLDTLSRTRAADFTDLPALARLTCSLFTRTLEELAADSLVI